LAQNLIQMATKIKTAPECELDILQAKMAGHYLTGEKIMLTCRSMFKSECLAGYLKDIHTEGNAREAWRAAWKLSAIIHGEPNYPVYYP